MNDSDDIGFRARLFRDNGGELVVAAAYLLAWGFGAWVPERVLLALVVGVGLQFFVVTMLLGAITPRTPATIVLCVAGHAALFGFLAWVASAGGRQSPDLLAVALAQAPLLLRNLERAWRPGTGPGFLLEAIGPFLLLMPVLIATVVLAAVLPDAGLLSRELRFEHLAPLPGKDVEFALLAGAMTFGLGAVARTAWSQLGGDEHRRAGLDAATIRRWREDYERSRGRR